MVGKNSHGHIEIKVQSVPPPPPPSLFRPPYEWYPWIVTMFVNIDIIIFIVSMYINNCPAHSRNCIGAPTLQRFAFENIHQNPLLGPSTDTLVKMGALDADKVIRGGQQWRILTCMWLHAGVFHIFANMLSLLGVGVRLEQEFGFESDWFIYCPESVVACCRRYSSGKRSPLVHQERYSMAALTTLIFMILINLMVGILPHVDNFAHIGGFVTGFFLGFILLIRPHFHWTSQPISPFGYYGHQRKTRYKLYQYILLILSIIVLIVM
ncbi:Peptidase S54, rhomboid [Cynara cardunculus var. scolymus]|uniref:RHOMBOID-like protein n=1 Tax=Cynara cardunculus var. scolymus TaxID=59895 RepID=A0A103XPZ8_CYNCS|nr:Peptidase S54, rhomboid [Cynara cardunculus var. scolymus]